MDKILNLLKANKNDIIKPVFVLLAICVIIPLALSVTNKITSDRIAMLEVKSQNDAMAELVEADTFDAREFGEESQIEYTVAIKDSKTVGYIFITSTKGYSGGNVSVMTAINPDGTVKAIKILDVSNETPGLGQNASKESFYSQFSGKKKDIKAVKNSVNPENNEIKTITGATITSKAVTVAVNEALENYYMISLLSSTYVPETEVVNSEAQ
jgi:electron transport complex protein RnfG